MKAKYVVILCGCFFGLGFYITPTKEIISTEQQKKISELEQKLKEKKDVVTYRTIYKDKIIETVVDRSVSESNTKTNETEATEKKEVVKVNPQNILAEVGLTLERDVYLHITAPIFWRLTVGVHPYYNLANNNIGFGAGVGFRF